MNTRLRIILTASKYVIHPIQNYIGEQGRSPLSARPAIPSAPSSILQKDDADSLTSISAKDTTSLGLSMDQNVRTPLTIGIDRAPVS